MKLIIFDVEHGFCAIAHTNTGKTILFDCGHNNTTGWRPSDYIRNYAQIRTVDLLVMSHYDEDHLSDLVNVTKSFSLGSIVRNRTVPTGQIENLKRAQGGCGEGVKEAIRLIGTLGTGVGGATISAQLGVDEIDWFSPPYPTFQDTNNLSVVVYVKSGGMGFLLPGDIEAGGWIELLKKQSFRDCLKKTNVLIASHHGRRSGYCEEIFKYCKPELTIVSDTTIKHDTQVDVDYRQHTSGKFVNNRTRYVLTTRNDGMITVEQANLNLQYHANTSKGHTSFWDLLLFG